MKEISFQILLDEIKAEEINKHINIKETKQEDYTLSDLRQKLVNDLYKIPVKQYEMIDVEILKILFENSGI